MTTCNPTHRNRQSMLHSILAGAVVFAQSVAAAAREQETSWSSPEWPSAKPADVGLESVSDYFRTDWVPITTPAVNASG